MSGSYRPTGRSSRATRAAHDHDWLDGLPVRRWQRQWVTVSAPSTTATPSQPDIFPLPKDAHLLSATSQALLAAARANNGSRHNENQGSHDAQKDNNNQSAGQPLFTTKRWVCLPKHMEPPEPIYLAKVPGVKRGVEEISGGQGEGAGGAAVGGVRSRNRPPIPQKKKAKRGRKKKVDLEREAAEKAAADKAAAEEAGRQEGEQKAAASVVDAVAPGGEAVKEVEMMDIDAATAEDEVPQNQVAQEVEKMEVEEEKQALEKTKETSESVEPAPITTAA